MKRFRPIDFALLLIAVPLIVVLVVFPMVSSPLDQAGWLPEGWESSLKYVAWAQTFFMQAFLVCWFTFFGSCFASFLNVVAWRVPRGRTINGSSHCPKCDFKLRLTDNIPIYGWLRNGGRCSSCKASISPRYLIVELILGAITLAVVCLEIFGSGVNLPGFPVKSFRLIENVVLEPQTDLFTFSAFHLSLIYVLFSFAVIRNERLPIPASIFAVGAFFGVLFQICEPHLTAVSYLGEITTGSNQMNRLSMEQVLTLITGIIAGGVVGYGVSRLPWFSSATFESAFEKDLAELEAAKRVCMSESVVDKISEKETEKPSEPLDSIASCPEVEVKKHATLARYRPVTSIQEAVAGFSLIGLFLGWPAVLFCLAILIVLIPIRKLFSPELSLLEPIASQLLLGSTLFVLGYRWIVGVLG